MIATRIPARLWVHAPANEFFQIKLRFPLMPKTFSPRLTTCLSLLVVLALLSLSSACQTQTAADTRAADETTLKNLDAEWSKAAGAKDVEKTVSYYTDDAQILPPNMPSITNKQGARAMWGGMFSVPGFGGGWTATKVEVARSGDIGYVTGTYELSETDASGKPIVDKGKYLEVWKKQADGSWKCVIDMFNSDLPSVASPGEK
jgi:ketosteroid isomerase-like protein